MNVSVAIDEGVAPEFVEPLKPKIVKPENPATLKAVVTGKPVPVVTWYQNDRSAYARARSYIGSEERLVKNTNTLSAAIFFG